MPLVKALGLGKNEEDGNEVGVFFMMAYFTKVFVSFLVIMNPASIVPVFIELTSNDTLDDQRKTAIKATLTAAIILLAFAAIGDWLLSQLEISSSALLVAGGTLLMIFAIQRVFGGESSRKPTPDEKVEAQHKRDLFVFPLAVPMIAGPGALTVVMFQMKQAAGDIVHQAILIFAMVLVLSINGFILWNAKYIARILGVTGTNVITRVFGIILAAIAAQLILNGVKSFFNFG
jgi:multiple antibiotic resistance protein